MIRRSICPCGWSLPKPRGSHHRNDRVQWHYVARIALAFDARHQHDRHKSESRTSSHPWGVLDPNIQMSIKDALGTIFTDPACDGAVDEFAQLVSVIKARTRASCFWKSVFLGCCWPRSTSTMLMPSCLVVPAPWWCWRTQHDDAGCHAHAPPTLLMDQPAFSNQRDLSMSASYRRLLRNMDNTQLKIGANRITNAKDTEQRLYTFWRMERHENWDALLNA